MDYTRNIMTTVDYKRLERCIADGRVDVADYLIQSGERKPNGDTEPSPTVWCALNKGNVQMIDLFVRNNVWRPSGAILMDALFISGNMELFDALDRFTPNWRAEFNWHIRLATPFFECVPARHAPVTTERVVYFLDCARRVYFTVHNLLELDEPVIIREGGAGASRH